MYIEMSDQVSLYVKQAGEGFPCLFIHGGPGEGSLDFEVLGGNALESFMEIIYFDQRGSARSGGAKEDDYSIERIVEDIEEIRKKLGIAKWNVMAHSFGGIIAANYAHQYEHRVNKLILVNATLHMEDSLKSQMEYGSKLLPKETLQTIAEASPLEAWQHIVKNLLEKNLYYQLQYETYDNFLKLNKVNHQIENFNAAMANQAFQNEAYFKSYFELTKGIKVPVLILTGEEDYAIGPSHYKNFRFPSATIKIMQGKHMLYLENKEAFQVEVKAFVEA